MSDIDVQQLHIPAGTGETTASDMVIKARASVLGGDFSIMEGTVRPREMITPHTHEHEDQAVYIIEGELVFEIGGPVGVRFTAAAGDWVMKPRGISHGFWNLGESTVRYVELSGRNGFERFIDARRDGVVNMVRTADTELGMHTHTERIPALVRELGLTGLAGVNLPGPLKGAMALARFLP
ncbi:MAG: cupin domain-containing protein [Myxococcota bacterium]